MHITYCVTYILLTSNYLLKFQIWQKLIILPDFQTDTIMAV